MKHAWVENGCPLDWSNWLSGKPNNDHYNEDVGVIMKPANGGQWDDKPYVQSPPQLFYPLCEHTP